MTRLLNGLSGKEKQELAALLAKLKPHPGTVCAMDKDAREKTK